MFNPIDAHIIHHSSVHHISEDAAERSAASAQFQKLMGRAARLRVLSQLRGRSRQLLRLQRLNHAHQGHFLGLQTVPLAAIRGTENRSGEFDIEFLPTSEHVGQRWISVAVALGRGIPLPPVELIRVGDTYFVRDGHHRISVMKALGYQALEALVIAYP